MGDVIHLDYETFSEADLEEVGAYRYAVDPTTCVLMLGIALNNEEPRILLPPEVLHALDLEPDEVALQWASRWLDGVTPVYAHNAGFEIAITRYRLMKDLELTGPKLCQWRCTAAMARRAALPGKLEKLGEVLELRQQKDKRGKALLKIFSQLQTKGKRKGQRIMPWEQADDFKALIEYCLQDVRTEQDVHKKLNHFELKDQALRVWRLDCKLNDRGVPVNVKALRTTQVIIDEVQADQGAAFVELTGLRHKQRDRVFEWFKERGYPEDDMKAVSVARALDDTSWAKQDVKQALQLKADLSFAAINKVTSMLECDCGDGLVRGTLLYYGAGPGRWAGRLIQPQNFKRPTFSDTEAAYAAICNGDVRTAEDLQLLFGTPFDVISSCIRHYIQLPNGQKMYDADYAAIEARIVCWLAGQEDALERFRRNIDSYVMMAEFIFSKLSRDVSKDERWLGKQTVLGCGFQMGPPKFFNQCVEKSEQYGIKGLKITMPLAEKAVAAFREQYDKVADLWWDCDRAARNAILNPGKVFKAGPLLKFVVLNVGNIPFLVMRLPAGRSIVYPWPKLEANPKRPGKTEITFFGKLPMKSGKWGRIKTYGGKLVENATQGTAADVMGNGACNADERGFDIVTLIHDQALGADDGRDVEEFCDALTTLPSWAAGLPVKAEGKLVPYYLKL